MPMICEGCGKVEKPIVMIEGEDNTEKLKEHSDNVWEKNTRCDYTLCPDCVKKKWGKFKKKIIGVMLEDHKESE